MHRELTVERRGDLYHLRFHDFMGPWEGHRLEELLDLEEVPAAAAGESAVDLGPNQSCLLRPMDFEPDLIALVTTDRLPRVAQIVRDRGVEVIEGNDLLPEAPPERIDFVAEFEPVEENYVARIEESHRSAWEKGPKALFGFLALRLIPLIVVIYAAIVVGRHTGDPYQTVSLGEVVRQSEAPHLEQSGVERLFSPDRSDHLRVEIRRVLYADGPYMILGDGHFVNFVGAEKVMPWLDRVRMTSSPLIVETVAANGHIAVEAVRCGAEVMARDLELEVITRLASTGSPPVRDASGAPGSFRPIDTVAVGSDADVATLRGEALSLEGRLVRERGELVLRMKNGTGVELQTSGVSHGLERLLNTMTGRDCTIAIDLVVKDVNPWSDRGSGPLRKERALLGVGQVYSASAQNHHVVGRKLIAS